MWLYIMHRTQVLLEEHQYRRLKREAQNSGRSIGELVRGHRREVPPRPGADVGRAGGQPRRAGRDDIGDGAEYVERIRNQSIEDRLTQLGWE